MTTLATMLLEIIQAGYDADAAGDMDDEYRHSTRSGSLFRPHIDNVKFSFTYDDIDEKHIAVWVEGRHILTFTDGTFDWKMHSPDLEQHVTKAATTLCERIVKRAISSARSEMERKEKARADEAAFRARYGVAEPVDSDSSEDDDLKRQLDSLTHRLATFGTAR